MQQVVFPCRPDQPLTVDRLSSGDGQPDCGFGIGARRDGVHELEVDGRTGRERILGLAVVIVTRSGSVGLERSEFKAVDVNEPVVAERGEIVAPGRERHLDNIL